MNIQDTIKYTIDIKNKYSSVDSLINDYNIKVKYIELESSNIYASNFKAYGTFFILLNSNVIDEYNRDFVLAHEMAHILLHDDTCRMFDTLCYNSDKFEVQANLFATLFLGYGYNVDNNNPIQKIINYIHCNYRICDMTRIK